MIKLVKNDFFIYCKEARIESNRSFYGSFSLGPFDAGQSITIANALRRTLLSELKGLAITSAEIEGAFHEYSTLPGVRDSILDILLNLKDIVLKAINFGNQKKAGSPNKKKTGQRSCLFIKGSIKKGDLSFSAEQAPSNVATFKKEQIGYLKTRGPGIVTAAELKLPPGIQCVDPDQYIATLSEEGILNIKFNINEGKNYVIQTYKKNYINPPDLPVNKGEQENKKDNSIFFNFPSTAALLNENPLSRSLFTNGNLSNKGITQGVNPQDSWGSPSTATPYCLREPAIAGLSSSFPPVGGTPFGKGTKSPFLASQKKFPRKNKKWGVPHVVGTHPLFLEVASDKGAQSPFSPPPPFPSFAGDGGGLRYAPQRSWGEIVFCELKKHNLRKVHCLKGIPLRTPVRSNPLGRFILLAKQPFFGYRKRRLWLKNLKLINTLGSVTFQQIVKKRNINSKPQQVSGFVPVEPSRSSVVKLVEDHSRGTFGDVPLIEKKGPPLALQKLPMGSIGLLKEGGFSIRSLISNNARGIKFNFLKNKRCDQISFLHSGGAVAASKAAPLAIDAVFMPVNKVNYIIEINEQSVMSKDKNSAKVVSQLLPNYIGETLHRVPLHIKQPLLRGFKRYFFSNEYSGKKKGGSAIHLVEEEDLFNFLPFFNNKFSFSSRGYLGLLKKKTADLDGLQKKKRGWLSPSGIDAMLNPRGGQPPPFFFFGGPPALKKKTGPPLQKKMFFPEKGLLLTKEKIFIKSGFLPSANLPFPPPPPHKKPPGGFLGGPQGVPKVGLRYAPQRSWGEIVFVKKKEEGRRGYPLDDLLRESSVNPQEGGGVTKLPPRSHPLPRDLLHRLRHPLFFLGMASHRVPWFFVSSQKTIALKGGFALCAKPPVREILLLGKGLNSCSAATPPFWEGKAFRGRGVRGCLQDQVDPPPLISSHLIMTARGKRERSTPVYFFSLAKKIKLGLPEKSNKLFKRKESIRRIKVRLSDNQTKTSIKNNIILEIWTNGSLHPRQALYEACKNLLSLFSKLEKATPLSVAKPNLASLFN